MSVLGLMVPVFLLGVGVQGVRGQVPRSHISVCALLQEQRFLLAPAGESVRSSVPVLILGVIVQGVQGKMPWHYVQVFALLLFIPRCQS